VIYLATDYGILKTENRGETFEAIQTLLNFGNRIDTVAVAPANNAIIYFTRGNKLHKSENAGLEWRTLNIPTAQSVSQIKILKSDPNIIYLGLKKVTK
jgi:photosystem II stability/assembly factor-like uncharacterized protein